jgi:hypothetical protein
MSQPDSPRNPAPRDEIHDELTFHLRALVDENLAKGMPLEAAWDDAQQRFGSLSQYAAECRRATPRGRLAAGLFGAGLVTVAALALWAVLQVREFAQVQRAEKEAMRAAFAAERAALRQALVRDPQTATPVDYRGRVVDTAGKPIAGANLLVILKTWPAGRYRQQDFATVSDEDGAFCLPKLIPGAGQFAVQAAALKDGYALASRYDLVEAEGGRPLKPAVLKLEQAVPVTLRVVDAAGQPIPGAAVVPSSRRTLSGQEHLIYFQGSEPARMACDERGLVTLRCFEPGDQAEVYVQAPGSAWKTCEVKIGDAGSTIDVSIAGKLVSSGSVTLTNASR